jgi:hypothetical protein
MDTTSLSTKKERGDSELKLVEWSPHQPGVAVVRCATRREVEEIRSVHSSIPNSFYHLIVLDQRLIFPITV